MDNLVQIEKIEKQEIELGLTLEKFKKKYVFSHSQSADAFYYDRFAPSPSQLIGFTRTEQLKIKNLGCLMIIQAGVFLRLPITTTISAQIIFHYFYQRVSLMDYDFRDVAMGAVFLSAQCEQTIRRSAHVALVFDQIFKIHEKSRRPTRIADIESKQFKAIQSKIIQMETTILIQLGFEVYKILETPHRYMNSILQMFNKHPELQKISQMSWGYLNDSYRTSLCLYYPGQMIAVASIYLSMRKLNLNIGSVPWWCLLQSSLEIMESIAVNILSIYDNRIDYYGAEGIHKKVAEKLNRTDVFPVPYYRKISIVEVQKSQLQIKQKEQQQQREHSRERSRTKKTQPKRSQSPSSSSSSSSKSIQSKNKNLSPNKPKPQSTLQKFSTINSKLNTLLSQKNQQKALNNINQLQIDEQIDSIMLQSFRKKFLQTQNKQ